MNILHIAVGFTYTNVYTQLINGLYLHKDINQNLFVPLHIRDKKYDEQVEKIRLSKKNVFSYKSISKMDSFLYFPKIQKNVNYIINESDLSQIELIHAHSLYSDGAMAYEIYKVKKIPYIVTLRNTDLNKYYKYYKHISKYAKEILKNASKIIFISPSYKNKFLESSINPGMIKTDYKLKVVPNGIDEFWHNNAEKEPRVLEQDTIKFLTIGNIEKNKNQLTVARVLSHLNIPIEYNLIGNIKDEKYYDKLSNFSFINYLGVMDKNEILSELKKNDVFIMLSINETFGLVYVEAASQGLPAIYSKGEGIDGFFNEYPIGEAASSKNEVDIINAVEQVIENYKRYSENAISESQFFEWKNIVDRYKTIYEEVIYEK